MMTDVEYPRVISALHGLDARQIRVGKTVAAVFHQITDAILVSRPYDRIEVESGTYFENITIQHPLELCGAKDAEPPNIVSVGPCVTIDTDGPMILHGINITAKGLRAVENQAVVVKRGKPRIEDCEMSSLHVRNDAQPHVSHCRIHGSRHGAGVSIMECGGGVYEHNHIYDHECESLYMDTAGKPVVRHNRITEIKGRNGVVVHMSGRLSGKTEVLFHDNIINGGGEGFVNSDISQVSVLSLREILKRITPESAALVRLVHGAQPIMVSNLLYNGVSGFRISDCKLSPHCFCGNRIGNCSAWGIVVTGNSTAMVDGNDIQSCGAGIYARTGHAREEDTFGDKNKVAAPAVSISRCNLQWNAYLGFVIDKSAVTVSECNIAESSTGIAFVGNCTGSVITGNVLTKNGTSGISVYSRGSVSIGENVITGCNKGMYGVVLMEGSNVALQGVKVKKVATAISVCGGSRLLAEGSTVEDTSVHQIVVGESSHATLRKNTLKDSGSASIVVTGQSDCHLFGNSVLISQKEGVLVEEGSKVTIEKNNLSSMREAIYVKRGGAALVQNNDIAISRYGVVAAGRGTECTIVGNSFRGMTGPGVYALEGSTASVRNNSMRDSSATCIQAGSDAEVHVEGCTFADCRCGVVHVDGGNTYCKVVKCSMNRIGYGIWFTGTASGVVEENSINSCGDFGVACEARSPVAVQNSTIADSEVGLSLCGAGTFSGIAVTGCRTGILAKTGASDKVSGVQVTDCNLGISLMPATAVSITGVKVHDCHKHGITVLGPSPEATVLGATFEKCGVSGVTVLEEGACMFEQCVICRNVNGVMLRQPGNVSFTDCFIAQQRRGIVLVRGRDDDIGRMSTPPRSLTERSALFLSCTVEGLECEEGVVASSCDAALRLQKCKISAGVPDKGIGVVAKDGAVVQVTNCDITQCSRAGFLASPTARLSVEHVTIGNCGIGVLFASPTDEATIDTQTTRNGVMPKFEAESVDTCTSKGNNWILSLGISSNAPRWATFKELTISRCENTGLWYMPQSTGEVVNTTVKECAVGIVAEHGSRPIVQVVHVYESKGCGVLLPAKLSSEADVSFITIQSSKSHGLEVSADANDQKSDDVAAVTIKNCEIHNNKGNGVVLQASVSLQNCFISGNELAGICCRSSGRSGTQPRISVCHLENNKEANIVATGSCVPQLHSCILETADVGIRVESAINMVECILRYMKVATIFTDAVSSSSESSTSDSEMLRCVMKDNGTGLSCHWNGCVSEESRIVVGNCVFDNSSCMGVQVGRGPAVRIAESTFETSRIAISVEEDGRAETEGCTFVGNLQGVVATNPQHVEIQKSHFLRDGKVGIIVRGEKGEVQIHDNTFRDSTERGLYISTAGVRTYVQNNIFDQATYGLIMEESPKVYIYNNTFRRCRTGLMLRSAACCGTVVSNVLDGNVCGCVCENGATAKLWKNVFCGNKAYGIMVTTGARPTVMGNVFRQQNGSDGKALSVCDGGMGHFANNEFMSNTCGVHLESTGGVVIVNNNAFDGNDVGVHTAKETKAHIVTCFFTNSSTADVCAPQQIARGQCILAYNCFCSKNSTAVALSGQAAVIIYRSMFIGAKGKGLTLEGPSQWMVCESFFYGLDLGVLAGERAAGRVVSCTFVRCLRVSEVCQHAKTIFYSCSFFGRSSGPPGMLTVNVSAEPTFSLCEIFGADRNSSPLLCSSGGGVVEECLFSAGNTSVLLDCDCNAKFQRNKFLRGTYGVVMVAGCAPTLESNVFGSHDKVAVKIMNNAGGVLRENAFVQPVDNGGIFAAADSVAVENCKQIESSVIRDKKHKALVNPTEAEEKFVTSFAKYLRSAPVWVRSSMREMRAAETFPPSVLESLDKTQQDEKEGEHSGPEELEGVEGRASKVDKEAGERTPTGDGAHVDAKQKRSPTLSRGSVQVRRKRKVLPFEFTPGDDITRVPETLLAELQVWVERSNIVLTVEGRGHCALSCVPQQACGSGMLVRVDESVSLMKQLQFGRRGDYQLHDCLEECRGTRMSASRISSYADSDRGVYESSESEKGIADGLVCRASAVGVSTADEGESHKAQGATIDEPTDTSAELQQPFEDEGEVERVPRHHGPPLRSTDASVRGCGPPKRGPLATFSRTVGTLLATKRKRTTQPIGCGEPEQQREGRSRRRSLAISSRGISRTPTGTLQEDDTPASSGAQGHTTLSERLTGVDGDTCLGPSCPPSRTSHFHEGTEDLSCTTSAVGTCATELETASNLVKRTPSDIDEPQGGGEESLTSTSRPSRDLLKNVTLNFSLLGHLPASHHSNRDPLLRLGIEELGTDDDSGGRKADFQPLQSDTDGPAKTGQQEDHITNKSMKFNLPSAGLRAIMLGVSMETMETLSASGLFGFRGTRSVYRLIHPTPRGESGLECLSERQGDAGTVSLGKVEQTAKVSKKGRKKKKKLVKRVNKIYPVSGMGRRRKRGVGKADECAEPHKVAVDDNEQKRKDESSRESVEAPPFLDGETAALTCGSPISKSLLAQISSESVGLGKKASYDSFGWRAVVDVDTGNIAESIEAQSETCTRSSAGRVATECCSRKASATQRSPDSKYVQKDDVLLADADLLKAEVESSATSRLTLLEAGANNGHVAAEGAAVGSVVSSGSTSEKSGCAGAKEDDSGSLSWKPSESAEVSGDGTALGATGGLAKRGPSNTEPDGVAALPKRPPRISVSGRIIADIATASIMSGAEASSAQSRRVTGIGVADRDPSRGSSGSPTVLSEGTASTTTSAVISGGFPTATSGTPMALAEVTRQANATERTSTDVFTSPEGGSVVPIPECPRAGSGGLATTNIFFSGVTGSSTPPEQLNPVMLTKGVGRTSSSSPHVCLDRVQNGPQTKVHTVQHGFLEGANTQQERKSQGVISDGPAPIVPRLRLDATRARERSVSSVHKESTASMERRRINHKQPSQPLKGGEQLRQKRLGAVKDHRDTRGFRDVLLPSGSISSPSVDESEADCGLVFWKPIGHLSEGGRAMLEAVQNEVLSSERGVSESLRDVVLKTECEEVYPARWQTATFTEIPMVRSCDGSTDESELEASVEDVIAVLQWLADMRQRKMMSNEGFSRAVDCVKERSSVPFFFCENPASGLPTVMVRLPKSADEVVVIPLLNAEQNIEIVRDTIMASSNTPKLPVVALQKVVEGVSTLNNGARVALPSLVKGSGRASSDGSPRAPASVNASSLSTTQAHRSVHNGPSVGADLLAMLDGSLKETPPASGWSPCARSEGTSARPAVASHTVTREDTVRRCAKRRLVVANSVTAARFALPFNPADPKGTSPFVNAEKIANFITAGTTNVML